VRATALLVVVVLATACAASESDLTRGEAPTATALLASPTVVAEASPTVAIPAPPPDPTATSTPPPTPMPDPTATPETGWSLEILAIDDAQATRMTPTSWRDGCPVGLDDLQLLRFPHVDFDGAVREAELVISADWAEEIGQVFQRLFEARYPIQQIRLVDTFEGDDVASMQANNTSGFNCRRVGTGTGAWSNHAFGLAIDLNPLMNPLVQGDFVDPPEGAEYLDRADIRLGMVAVDDPAVAAFAEVGWIWGGTWSGLKDYQHFSANGG
jgi:hypothetical protein